MTPNAKSIFREIAKGLPPEQLTVFWEMVAHLEKLPPDDEILRVCQAMGVLTLVTQKIPATLTAEREAWRGLCDEITAKFREMMNEAHQRSVELTREVAGLAQEVNATGRQVVNGAERIEKAMRHGADGVSTDKLSQDVKAKMEAAILKPGEETIQKMGKAAQRIVDGVPKLEGAAERLENYNYSSAWGTAFVVCATAAILLVGGIWLKLDYWYHDSLADEVRQIDARTAYNEAVVKALNDLGRGIEIYPKDGKYLLALPDATDAWMSTTHAGVIQFVPKQ